MNRSLIATGLVVLTVTTAACGSDTPTTPSTSTPTATTDTFTSVVERRGSTSRSFATSAQGIVTLTLTSLGQEAASVSLALGLSDPATGQCTPTFSVVTSVYAGRAVSVKADTGSYCFIVSDIGELNDRSTFGVDVTHF